MGGWQAEEKVRNLTASVHKGRTVETLTWEKRGQVARVQHEVTARPSRGALMPFCCRERCDLDCSLLGFPGISF